ncbi:MAG TPA: phosphoadenylyl-sulfate reductase [Thermoanaerobaculia bacterium]|nr:phosphoadenylyl-sulfate reductase [Thermoanaerobaculia bacterium]
MSELATAERIDTSNLPDAEDWTAKEVIAWGISEFGGELAIASSFGAEDVVLIDIAANVTPDLRIFTLDTDFLFPETYSLIERIEQRYGITVERARAEHTPEEQARELGEALWTRQPDVCCNLRKVEPLTRKLAGLRAWITGIRRDQSPARANARKIEWDERFGLVKLNPLADWNWDELWRHIKAHGVDYNPLHDANYPSIGCTHCTRCVLPGEDPRAGRWSGTAKTECGLHVKS